MNGTLLCTVYMPTSFGLSDSLKASEGFFGYGVAIETRVVKAPTSEHWRDDDKQTPLTWALCVWKINKSWKVRI